MTIQKGSPFLRVTHAGQTTGSLFLADLADEENARQNRKIPVYVPEGGSIDLPFEEDVLLSYQQGTIRGLEDQGYLTTTVIDDGGALPIVWASKNGDDSNPGTRNAPYRNLQTAIDALVDEYGHDVHKEVRLLDNLDTQNDYIETGTTFIRTKNLTLKGVGNTPVPLASSDITFVITNILDWDAFQTDGGLGYSVATAAYTPSHATIADRDVDPDLGVDDINWNIRFENLRIDSYSDNGVNGQGTSVAAVFSAPTGSDVQVNRIQFHDCAFNCTEAGFSPSGTKLFFRSCSDVMFSGNNEMFPGAADTEGKLVFENCLDTAFVGHVQTARPLFYFDTTDDLIPSAATRRMLDYGTKSPDLFVLHVDWDGETPELRSCNISEVLRIETNVTLFGCTVNNLEGNGTATMEGGGYYGTNSATVSHTALQTT